MHAESNVTFGKVNVIIDVQKHCTLYCDLVLCLGTNKSIPALVIATINKVF